MKGQIRYMWKLFLARFRISMDAVCEMSKGKGMFDDYHDYQDDETGSPFHLVEMKCKRCGKGFYI